jgi:hypothetical protein
MLIDDTSANNLLQAHYREMYLETDSRFSESYFLWCEAERNEKV